jgi:hypothetical protein
MQRPAVCSEGWHVTELLSWVWCCHLWCVVGDLCLAFW